MFWRCVLFWGSVSDGILPGIVLERVASNLGPVGWRPGLGENSRVAGFISLAQSSVWAANFGLVLL